MSKKNRRMIAGHEVVTNDNAPEMREPSAMHAQKIAETRARIAALKEQHSTLRLQFLMSESQILGQLQQADQATMTLVREAAGALGIDVDSKTERWSYDWQAGVFKREPDEA